MKEFTFVTGNSNKAEYLARLIEMSVRHQKIDLDEIQTTDLREVVEHKVRQAYEAIGQPVLVEDVSLEFNALSGLPGTFIKFFVEETGLEATCRMLDGFQNRTAVAKCGYGYFDGKSFDYFEGSITGTIADHPGSGEMGFGWDKIFIPEGYGGIIRSELSKEQYDELYLVIKPISDVRDFLKN